MLHVLLKPLLYNSCVSAYRGCSFPIISSNNVGETGHFVTCASCHIVNIFIIRGRYLKVEYWFCASAFL